MSGTGGSGESKGGHHDHKDGDCSSCCNSAPTNPSVHQSLDELQFERSIFQAAIDNNVDKIITFSKMSSFDVNATDNYGYTALHYASRNNSLDSAKTLVQLGASINLPTRSLKSTALHRAVTANKVEMVKFLLSVGADPKLQDADGLSPFDRAKKENRHEVIEAFKEAF